MLHKILSVVSLLVVSVLLAAMPTGHALAIGGQEIMRLTNTARQGSGLKQLSWNPRLSNAAYQKASDMCSKDYWAHQSPSGKSPWDFISAAGYDYRTAGENLARGFTSDSGVINGWLNSPGHRQNMLNATYSEVGVGIKQCTMSGKQTTVVVAHYAQPFKQVKTATAPVAQVKQPQKSLAQSKTAPQPTARTKSTPQKTHKPATKRIKTSQRPSRKAHQLAINQLLVSLLGLNDDTSKLKLMLLNLG